MDSNERTQHEDTGKHTQNKTSKRCNIRLFLPLKDQFEGDMCREMREEIKRHWEGMEAICERCQGGETGKYG